MITADVMASLAQIRLTHLLNRFIMPSMSSISTTDRLR